MSNAKFGVNEVRSLVAKSEKLGEFKPTDFEAGGLISEEGMTNRSKTLMSFYKPILEQADWSGGEGHNPAYAKRAEATKKLLACHAMHQRLSVGVKRLAGEARIYGEATTAGVDLPTFVRQLLLTITRAYARLFTPELFGVIPLNQPYGRIHFKDYKYDSSFVGSTPNITGGTDRTDDITKFNSGFYASPEGTQANRLKFTYTNLDVSVNDYRVISDFTDQLADDAASVYDDDAEQTLIDHQAQEMARVIDRAMVTAAFNAIPAANKYTWNSAPASNPNYAALSPSEAQAWDERLYRDGINTVISQIRVTRKYNNDGDPDWVIAGTDLALRLNKLTMFMPMESNAGRDINLGRGALRDLGELKVSNLRVLVDPMLGATATAAGVTGGNQGGASLGIFGRKPIMKNEVGLYWLPYINLQPTRNLYDPETGITTMGMRSRWAIAQPNVGTQPNSSQLGEVYGLLTVA